MPEVKAIPDGYHSIQPYLIYDNCAEAIVFYAKAFGGIEKFRMQRPDGRIGHAELQIGNSIIMMADDAPEVGARSIQHFGGSPVSLMIYTEDCDAMYGRALSAGGSSEREPADQPYGDRMAGIRDPFGYRWYIANHIKDVSLEGLGLQAAQQG